MLHRSLSTGISISGPLLDGGPGCSVEADDMPPPMYDNAGNRARTEAKPRGVLAILIGRRASYPRRHTSSFVLLSDYLCSP